MYRFKYYYRDGTIDFSGGHGKTPESLYNDFDGLMNWNEWEKMCEKELSTDKILKTAMRVYREFLKGFYRIEIVNTETNKIIDYIDESEIQISNNNKYLLYDVKTIKDINYLDEYIYRFKFYYDDGTVDYSIVATNDPTELYIDFDGIMDYREYDELTKKNLTTKEILDKAMYVYELYLKEFYRIEIINTKTSEIIDFVEKKMN